MIDLDRIMAERDKKLLLSSLQDTRNKLYGVLGKCRFGTTDATMKCCIELSNLSSEERDSYITENWSVDHLMQTTALIAQLKSIENALAGD